MSRIYLIIFISNHFFEFLGMVLTVCPCISEGNVAIRVLGDNSTVVTRDNSRTAQFGHTVLITEYGAEILSHWYQCKYSTIIYTFLNADRKI